MKRRSCFSGPWVIAVACAAGCATAPDKPRTIEPTSAPVAVPATPPHDSGFVLSRETAAVKRRDPSPLHIGDLWWPFRAEFLNISDDEVKSRDAAISERQAPANFWDRQTARETASIWGSLCNECHGGRRSLNDALAMPAPPPGWGRGEGLFFGNRREYSAVFATVNLGGPVRDGKRSKMPAWTGKLPKEQMWALLYFLEFQSGGIEGRFPPSLYPRPLQENR
jgi:mono/diheme cytochrome c family protein